MSDTPSPQSAFIWLASQSPRRQALLAQIGVRCQLLTAGAEEDTETLEQPRPHERPAQYVVRVTQAKALAAQARLTQRQGADAPILVADTTVALGQTLLGKPHDAAHARSMLRQLSDRAHRVYTAVQVVWGTRTLSTLSVSRVRFAALKPAMIERYIATGEPFGKAGAYAIQGHAAAFIQQIEGSYSGIMGLPLYQTAGLLRRIGFDLDGSP